MYTIEKESTVLKYYLLTFKGNVEIEEAEKWYEKSKDILETELDPFGLIINMENLELLLPKAQDVLLKGQQLYKEKGMQRSAIISDNALLLMQYKRITRESGISGEEKYFNTTENAHGLEKAIIWVALGKDIE
ncbi:MAG: hypothetical protein KAI43_13520 [Candidatus Aureabacteria bacterium]|nr:hypothetical protein [Candidatus Auribacterota bacterium]